MDVMNYPLMPRGVAVWLVEHTSLSFEQIAEFCGLHRLEIQALADMESSQQVLGMDPILQGELTLEEINRCEQNPQEKLMLSKPTEHLTSKKKRSKYTPLSKRGDRPDAIAWILKYYPDASEKVICKLLGTTLSTVKAVKEKTHWNMINIKPRDPAHIGLCSQEDLDRFVQKHS